MTTNNTRLTDAKLQANRTAPDIVLAKDFTFVTVYNETYLCSVILTRYSNGQNCIRLEDNIYGEPVAHATYSVNLLTSDPYHVAACDDHVVIKDYAENAGMLEQLQAAGIVSDTVVHINGIHSGLHLCELLQVVHATPAITAITDANKDKPTGDDRYDD